MYVVRIVTVAKWSPSNLEESCYIVKASSKKEAEEKVRKQVREKIFCMEASYAQRLSESE